MLHGVVLQSPDVWSSHLSSSRAGSVRTGCWPPIEHERVARGWLALGGAAGQRVAAVSVSWFATTRAASGQDGLGGAPVSPIDPRQDLRDSVSLRQEDCRLGMGYTSTEAGAVVAGIGGPEYQLKPDRNGATHRHHPIELRVPPAPRSPPGRVARSMSGAPISCSATGTIRSATEAALSGMAGSTMGDVADFERRPLPRRLAELETSSSSTPRTSRRPRWSAPARSPSTVREASVSPSTAPSPVTQ